MDCIGDAGSILGVDAALLGVAGALPAFSLTSFAVLAALFAALGPVGAFGGGNIFALLTGGPILTAGISMTVCLDGGPIFI